jgi:hypothetical protein
VGSTVGVDESGNPKLDPSQCSADNGINPNVKVVSQLLQKNGYDEFPALLTQIAAGHAPDVMRVLNYQPTQLVAQGNALMPLDDFIKNDKTLDVPDFVPVAWAAGKVGGKQFAVPQNGEPYNVHYNKDAFAKAGIKDPWAQYNAGTWNEQSFKAAAKALQEKAGLKFGAAWESWNYDVFVFMGGGKILDPKLKPLIQAQPSPKTLQYFSDMVNTDKTVPDPNVPSGNWLQYFTQQQLGMYLSGAWWAKYMPTVPFQWDSAPLPKFFGHLFLGAYGLLATHITEDRMAAQPSHRFISSGLPSRKGRSSGARGGAASFACSPPAGGSTISFRPINKCCASLEIQSSRTSGLNTAFSALPKGSTPAGRGKPRPTTRNSATSSSTIRRRST